MPENLDDVLAVNAYNLPQLSNAMRDPFRLLGGTGDGISRNQLRKCENHVKASPLTSMTVSSSPMTRPFPFVDEALPYLSKDVSVKEKLVAALREIIPYKSTLNLRMLVTYTVDNGESDVIVIDDTLHRKRSVSKTAEINALDLSQKTETEATTPTASLLTQNANDEMPKLPSMYGVQPQAPFSALNPEMALLVLHTLLNGGQQAALSNPSLELPPSMTAPKCPPILPLGATPDNSHCASGSRSSSPLSTAGLSPSMATAGLCMKPSTSFNRRPMHPRRFICNQCRQRFSLLAELNRHTLEQHNAFRCNFCKAKFTQRSNLQRHSLKHVGFKPFTCNVCRKEYYRKDHLVRHIEVTHPNVDPRANITTRMTSSECLDFLDNLHIYENSANSPNEDANLTGHSSPVNDASLSALGADDVVPETMDSKPTEQLEIFNRSPKIATPQAPMDSPQKEASIEPMEEAEDTAV